MNSNIFSAQGPTAVVVVGLTVNSNRISARGPTALMVVGLTRNTEFSARGLAAVVVQVRLRTPRPMLCFPSNFGGGTGRSMLM